MRERVDGLWRLAALAHPEKPLERGFARVVCPDGRTLTSAAAAGAEARMTLMFGDGGVAVTTAAASVTAPTRVERPRRRGYPGGDDQPGLL